MAKGRCLLGIQHWQELLPQSEGHPRTVEWGGLRATSRGEIEAPTFQTVDLI